MGRARCLWGEADEWKNIMRLKKDHNEGVWIVDFTEEEIQKLITYIYISNHGTSLLWLLEDRDIILSIPRIPLQDEETEVVQTFLDLNLL